MIDQKRFFDNYNKEADKNYKPQRRVKRNRAQVNRILKEVGLPSAETLIARGLRRRDKLQWLEKKHQLTKFINHKGNWFLKYHYSLKTKFVNKKNNINYKSFKLINKSKRLSKLNFLNQQRKRLIVIKINQKYKRYQYRKSREERCFLKTLVLNLQQQVTYPLFKNRIQFLTKLTKPLKPVILTRRRFLQPVYIRLQHQYSKPHNGLRLPKRRRV